MKCVSRLKRIHQLSTFRSHVGRRMHTVPEEKEYAFVVQTNSFKFGRGLIERELGDVVKEFGLKRIALFTDPVVGQLQFVHAALSSLKRSNIEAVVYDKVAVEPTDESFKEASKFAAEGHFDGFVSVGGGSVMDTCKAANLYSSHPVEDFLDYVNKSIGKGKIPPGPLKPHIAVPTTSGTGSELTGFAIFDLLSMKAKTAIGNKYMIPNMALIDPSVTESLPKSVVACSGFDVISHAIESYTARPYYTRPCPSHSSLRPLHQGFHFAIDTEQIADSNKGSNPYGDIGCLEALRIAGKFFLRAVRDSTDTEARDQMMFAASLAGSCLGNCGTHLPHGMSYPVSGLAENFFTVGYPEDQSLIPHGMSVILNAPSVFRFTSSVNPQRHLTAAESLGANTKGIHLVQDAGEALAAQLIHFMKATEMPNGLLAVGFGKKDIPQLVAGAWPQRRVIENAPKTISQEDLAEMYEGAMTYW